MCFPGSDEDFLELFRGVRSSQKIDHVLPSAVSLERDLELFLKQRHLIVPKIQRGFQGLEGGTRNQEGSLALDDCRLDRTASARQGNRNGDALLAGFTLTVSKPEVVDFGHGVGRVLAGVLNENLELRQGFSTDDRLATTGIQDSVSWRRH